MSNQKTTFCNLLVERLLNPENRYGSRHCLAKCPTYYLYHRHDEQPHLAVSHMIMREPMVMCGSGHILASASICFYT